MNFLYIATNDLGVFDNITSRRKAGIDGIIITTDLAISGYD